MNRRHFQLNEPDVSAEDFKSEILAVNLKNGFYYSLREASIPVWRLLMEGCDETTAAKWLAHVYASSAAEVEGDVTTLISDLEKAGLVRETPSPLTTTLDTPPAWLSELPPAYAKPVLETYTEMQDLLLLDPIHDVDEAGWPNERVPEAGQA